MLAWPPTVRLWPEAAQALGVGRCVAYDLVKRGEFPVRVLRLGSKYRIPTEELLKYLGIERG
jgi:excisionase family DNA binding protein